MQDFRIKYRPRAMKEVWGNDYVKKIWESFLRRKTFPKSIMLHGDFGTGKSTIGRIMAADISRAKEDFQWPLWPDVAEIDATKYDYNALRHYLENYSTLSCPPPAIFIDEAHRLQGKNQELFLKKIEDIEGVHFIFATTDINKIDGGILSRSTEFHLKNLGKQVLIKELMCIAGKENIEISPTALDFLIEFSGYNPRKCLGNLFQLSACDEKIEQKMVEEMVCEQKI